MIKREDFKKIVKIMSVWTISKKKGDYKLCSGRLSDYLRELINDFLINNKMGLTKNGVYEVIQDDTLNYDEKRLYVPFCEDVILTIEEEDKEINKLINEMLILK